MRAVAQAKETAISSVHEYSSFGDCPDKIVCDIIEGHGGNYSGARYFSEILHIINGKNEAKEERL